MLILRQFGRALLVMACLLSFASLRAKADVPIHEFETNTDFGSNQLTGITVSGGALSAGVTGNDPQVFVNGLYASKNISFDLAVYKKIVVRMKVSSNVTTSGAIYWGTNSAPGFSSGRVVSFSTVKDNAWHTYTIDMTTATAWSGFLNDLRVDPFGDTTFTSKTFSIDYIRLNSDYGDISEFNPMILNPMWRVLVGGKDYMSTNSTAERDAYPSDGSIFYLPQPSGVSQTPLFRYFNSTIGDHADDVAGSLSGYSKELTLGNPWVHPVTGTQAIQKQLNASTGDYGAMHPGETKSGYAVANAALAYAYPRDNNLATDFLSISGGGVTVNSNRAAGGAVYELWYNNIEFVNDWDNGRQMQAASYFNVGDGVSRNPTEAGKGRSGTSDTVWNNVQSRPTSPLIIAYNIGGTQVTQSASLEWNDLYGSSYNNPVVYPGHRLGKEITPNYNGLGPVLKYVTVVHMPIAQSSGSVEEPTVYLNGSFKNFFSFAADTNTLTNLNLPAYPTSGYGREISTINYGGAIVADGTATTSNALGFYGGNIARGGSVQAWAFYNFSSLGGVNEYDGGTGKISAVYRGAFMAGDNRFTTYVVVGTLASVQSQMRTLYSQGAL